MWIHGDEKWHDSQLECKSHIVKKQASSGSSSEGLRTITAEESNQHSFPSCGCGEGDPRNRGRSKASRGCQECWRPLLISFGLDGLRFESKNNYIIISRLLLLLLDGGNNSR
ncbi:hypothetical protein AFLA_012966 [Aspergillus flavus NRRL3357]|nr:hypothetical protein AFLA_012966 [Aspergillus flavus NRRL3357]